MIEASGSRARHDTAVQRKQWIMEYMFREEQHGCFKKVKSNGPETKKLP